MRNGPVEADTTQSPRFGRLIASIPASGVFLLPIGTCPACWPAYAAFLGSLGLGFLFSERVLLPVAVVLLVLALAALAYRAPTHRGFGPLLLGVAGAIAGLGGKFVFVSDLALYLGITLLLAASVWNTWPLSRQTGACSRCVTGPPTPGFEQETRS